VFPFKGQSEESAVMVGLARSSAGASAKKENMFPETFSLLKIGALDVLSVLLRSEDQCPGI
jgi:hypothetical protein